MLERTGATRLRRSEPNSLLRTRTRLYRFVSVAPLLAVALAFVSAGLAQQSKSSKKHAKTPAAPAAPVAIAVPFRPGEILEYGVMFSKRAVNASKTEPGVVEPRNSFRHPSCHFQAIARPIETTRPRFAIDHQLDSHTFAGKLLALE